MKLNAAFVSMIEVAYPLFVVLFGSFPVLFRTVPNLWFFAGGRPHHGGYAADHL